MNHRSMHLVQILLPLYDNEQNPQSPDFFRQVRRELTDRFGGITSYTRAPAEGTWKMNDNQTARDDIVIVEVMAPELDCDWWATYRHELEGRFRQDRIVIRAQQTRLL
jgi:hypothetical protein